jgi:hypothetical protein
MRLSESIVRRIFSPRVGGISYRFGGKSRRHTLFFEDLFAEYVKRCQDAGFRDELREIGRTWMGSVVAKRIPLVAKKLSPIGFMNIIIAKNLVNLGLMDYLRASKKDNTVSVKTRNEAVTRIIGRNEISVGIYSGILGVLFERWMEPINVYQSKEECRYAFKILEKRFAPPSKDPKKYEKLNELPRIGGVSLKKALKERIFILKEKNRIYFKSKPVGPIENTVFHLFGVYNLLFDEIPVISFNYFKTLIDENMPVEKKLIMLKTLLQAMGWGIVTFAVKPHRIVMEIRNPPYGLQAEKDNWGFLINVILGYLWTVNEKFRVNSVREDYKRITVDYTATQ